MLLTRIEYTMHCPFFQLVSLPPNPDFFIVHNEENMGMYIKTIRFDKLNTRLFQKPYDNLVVPYFFETGLYVVVLECKTTNEALKQLIDFERRTGFYAFRGFISVGHWNRRVMEEKQPLLSMLWDEGLTTDFYAESDEQIVS